MLLGLATTASAEIAKPSPTTPGIVVTLWPKGSMPGKASAGPEKALPSRGDNVLRLTDINEPAFTVYKAEAAKPTPAVIICPGGGYTILAYDKEGTELAAWLNSLGITGIVLKYRVPANQAGAFDDIQRAIRIVRHRAGEWNIAKDRVGVMGFSAGGEVAFLAAMRAESGRADAADPVDRLSARPDFQALIYPGKSQLIAPEKGAPPVFLAAGYGDRPDISEGLARVYLLFKQVGVPAELHLYAGAGHGFGVRDTNKGPAGAWISRFHDWLGDRGFLRAAKP